MATSSITENIRVNNPKVIEEFLDAMEELEKNPHPKTEADKSHVVTDPERIKSFMEKALRRREYH